jgi:hypothetical protein
MKEGLVKMSKFNQSKYIQQYIKEHKKRFVCDLNKDEFEELEKILKEKGLKKVEFLRNSIENLKKERRDNMENVIETLRNYVKEEIKSEIENLEETKKEQGNNEFEGESVYSNIDEAIEDLKRMQETGDFEDFNNYKVNSCDLTIMDILKQDYSEKGTELFHKIKEYELDKKYNISR